MSTAIRFPSTSGLEMEDAKQAIREAVRAHRGARSARQREQDAHAFAEHGVQAVGDARCVAAYVSTYVEPVTSALLDALHERGTRVLLPVLGPGLARCWGEYTGADDLAHHAPGRPLEPTGEVLEPESLAQADVVIAPALAVDRYGIRLGQGGGWYDRALQHRRPGVPVFAMVHEAELVDDGPLPRADHDLPVDAVITEERWFLLDGSPFAVKDAAPSS
ncbi:5-formyltetrahydrofolate cyclo-ligase [Georgenia sp. 311]|uniref:5-formyltetrahydrofolate cyclo-ligase n=1 Tax=Georgenia wutianyii TaxID=2585135 RepID=A0ABX5VIS9_9MICO|nr:MULTISPECIES: 5-formyltetrahydrofolate cyclo-ligase [Georgenia]QDB78272.1 5-formyltetrahydrofolate cyclo-ligase [Georgenia wutianyii]TNC18783.1 5-formyltetrahydrofolate cyclo-ligase [Georgenia sp. 311]